MSNEFTKIVAIAVGGDNFTEVVAIANPEDIGNTVEVVNQAALPTPSLALQGLIHFAKAENTYHVVNLAGNAFEEFGAGSGMNVIADYNASTNTPDLDSGTPIATLQGDRYIVTAAGLFFTKQVQVNDVLLARIDSATVIGDWSIQEGQEGVIENNIIPSGNGTVASAGTTDIGAETQGRLTVTGTTTITSFGTVAEGTERILTFSGILLLTHNGASLILPTGANITTAAGDSLEIISLGSGNWRVINYQRKDGTALVGGDGGDVNGPGSAVDENITVFNSTTGKLIKDSGINISAVAANTAKVTNANHSGDATGDTFLTIADNAVTLAKMADMATASLLGRNTAATGDPEVLSATTARSLLNVEDGSTADQSDSEIETAYNAQVGAMSQATAEAGTSTTIERVTAERIKQAIAKLTPVRIVISGSDITTDLTTGTAKVTFRMPLAMTLTDVRASVSTAPTGSDLIMDINEGGTTILSTKLSIPAGAKTSVGTPTAATGTVTLDSGASGSVDGITVNSVEIMSGAENFDTSLNQTAINVAANITANTSSPNYNASASGAVITITAVTLGSGPNGFVVVSSTTTIASTDVNMASGVDVPVISDSALADNAEMTIDIDAIGSSTAGKELLIYLIGVPV